MAGYSSASWAIGVLFSDCITKLHFLELYYSDSMRRASLAQRPGVFGEIREQADQRLDRCLIAAGHGLECISERGLSHDPHQPLGDHDETTVERHDVPPDAMGRVPHPGIELVIEPLAARLPRMA